MNVSLKTFLPITLVGAMTLTSCDDGYAVDKIASKYCLDNNKTEKDYRNIVLTKSPSDKVSKLDSIVYRDILETTKLAKDSAKIAGFNKIASSNRAPADYSVDTPTSQKNKAIEAGMLHKDFQIMTSYGKTSICQNLLDNFVYKKFFKENGVLDKNVEQKCDEYSKNIILTLM